MLDIDSYEHLIDGIKKQADKLNLDNIKEEVTEKEALEIYGELVELFARHNLSYQCVTRLSLAWSDTLLKGAAELYEQSS